MSRGRRRRDHSRLWSFAARWSTPVGVGITVVWLGVTGNRGALPFPLIAVTYLLLGTLWTFLVWQYGGQQRRDADFNSRYRGTHPPEGVWAEYAGERFEDLPSHYVGIKHGMEVWEVMLPKASPPDSLGVEKLPGRTTITTSVTMTEDDDS